MTVAGRGRTAVGVVMGQGQGSDTSVILDAAGEAATQLIESVAPAIGGRTTGASGAAGGPGGDAAGQRHPLLPAPRRAPGTAMMSTDAINTAGEHMRTRQPPATVALIAIVALISACGSTAPAVTGTGSSGGINTAANAQKAVKFAKCMRRNGVSRFPDPDAAGKLTIDAVANGSSLNTNTPAFEQAISACKDVEPAGFMGSKRSPQQQQAALRFAQCIRANDVKDFPDPTPNGPLVDTGRIPSAAEPGDEPSPRRYAEVPRCGSRSRGPAVILTAIASVWWCARPSSALAPMRRRTARAAAVS